MAAKRGKTQARRSGGGNGGLPGWAWLVIGVALTLLVVLAAPRLMRSGDEGFFRPRPNPDARPQPVDDEAVVEADVAADVPAQKPAAGKDAKGPDFDFYTLLPGKEVPVSDAELAASEQAEQQRARQDTAAPAPADPAATAVADAPTESRPPAQPQPVDAPPAPVAEAPPSSATPPAADADARYLLQAGAFEASGQAEELKAKIALLGVGARVESARIGDRTVYRVRMGPYDTASELAEAKRKLAAGGLSAIAIRSR